MKKDGKNKLYEDLMLGFLFEKFLDEDHYPIFIEKGALKIVYPKIKIPKSSYYRAKNNLIKEKLIEHPKTEYMDSYWQLTKIGLKYVNSETFYQKMSQIIDFKKSTI